MSGPLDELSGMELDDLVSLLRSATPPDALLEEVREATLGRAAAPTTPVDAAPLTHVGVALLALGLAVAVSPGPAVRVMVKGPAGLAAPNVETTASELATPGADEPEAAVAEANAPTEPDDESLSSMHAPAPGEPDAKPTAAIGRPVPALPLLLDIGDVPVMERGPGAPSVELADALRDYSRERYAEAAVKLQRVVEGATEDRQGRVAQAEFFLAKCLFHLGLYHASASAFDEITERGAAHRYFEASLTWLAMLAERLPEPRGVVASISRYAPEDLARLDRDPERARVSRLRYLMGRARYAERRYAEAIELLGQVPDGAPVSLEARFFEGVSHVREHRAQPALAAFRRVIESVDAGQDGGHPEPSRMRDLAWMSVARLYYSLAMSQPDRRDAHASELLSAAIEAWRRIPMDSEHWLDSFFEETWALYVAREYGRALGHVHALEAPYFAGRANPEAPVLRAMMQFEHCQWDAVERSVTRFHERFDPVMAAAERAERMANTHDNAFRMLVAVRRRRSRVPRPIVAALRAAYGDREITRQLTQIRSIDAEITRLEAQPTRFTEASIGTRVAADLTVTRAMALDRAGEMARERTRRLAAELRERMTQMDTVELELATARRLELTRPNPIEMGPAAGGPIMAVQGEQRWPWDGEWWRDEIPFYQQEIRSRCGR